MRAGPDAEQHDGGPAVPGVARQRLRDPTPSFRVLLQERHGERVTTPGPLGKGIEVIDHDPPVTEPECRRRHRWAGVPLRPRGPDFPPVETFGLAGDYQGRL